MRDEGLHASAEGTGAPGGRRDGCGSKPGRVTGRQRNPKGGGKRIVAVKTDETVDEEPVRDVMGGAEPRT